MVKRLLSLVCLSLAFSVQAQDLHFSLYHMSPLTLNPAMTGLFNGNARFTGNYRNQWASVMPTVPFRTFAGSVDVSGKSGAYNRVGAGLHVFTDKAGSLNLSRTSVSGSAAYTMALTRMRDYYFVAGIQASYTGSSYDFHKITTGSQFQDGAYNPNASTGEVIDNPRVSYVDAGVGLMWYHIRNIRNYQYVGASAFHLNRPTYAFMLNSAAPGTRIYPKYTVHFGAGFELGPRLDLVPHALGMLQGPHFEFTTGSFLKFLLDERKTTAYGGTSFYVGPFVRVVGESQSAIGTDAVILATKLDLEQITFGLSYDINVSRLSAASTGRGGPEFAIQYVTNFNNKRVKTFCPKF